METIIRYKKMETSEIPIAADLISRLNRIETNHIGYCGTDVDEITHTLSEIMEVTENQFIVAYDDDYLVGILGFDLDLEGKSAEIWGPFLEHENTEIAAIMWTKMLSLLPKAVKSIGLFPNIKNEGVIHLAERLGFTKQSEQTVLSYTRERKDLLGDIPYQELQPRFHQTFIQLHDQTFPNTYYNGQQILDRLNQYNKVFINEEDNALLGYIYVEAQPEFGEGNIEFFAVDIQHRGKGLGRSLLTVALKWLFTFENIIGITLCVDSSNQNAIHLYENTGFKRIHELSYFTKNYVR